MARRGYGAITKTQASIGVNGSAVNNLARLDVAAPGPHCDPPPAGVAASGLRINLRVAPLPATSASSRHCPVILVVADRIAV